MLRKFFARDPRDMLFLCFRVDSPFVDRGDVRLTLVSRFISWLFSPTQPPSGKSIGPNGSLDSYTIPVNAVGSPMSSTNSILTEYLPVVASMFPPWTQRVVFPWTACRRALGYSPQPGTPPTLHRTRPAEEAQSYPSLHSLLTRAFRFHPSNGLGIPRPIRHRFTCLLFGPTKCTRGAGVDASANPESNRENACSNSTSNTLRRSAGLKWRGLRSPPTRS